MAANQRRDTGPELRLRSLLHGLGCRFRVDFPIAVPGRRPVRPDIAFTRFRIGVFVDGCFWHGCPQHWSPPKSNRGYWTEKIEHNRERDRRADRLLTEAGWLVIRIWEHEQTERAAEMVLAALAERRASGGVSATLPPAVANGGHGA
jgi:DNA mismatch endonuclease (patch repair protein)